MIKVTQFETERGLIYYGADFKGTLNYPKKALGYFILSEEVTDLLYDFYKHLESCPGVDVNGIWEAIATFKPTEPK